MSREDLKRHEDLKRRRAEVARKRRRRRRRVESSTVLGVVIVGLIWIVSILCSLLITAAIVAIAGDVLGLWEAVEGV